MTSETVERPAPRGAPAPLAGRGVSPGQVVAALAAVHAIALFYILRNDYWAYDDWFYWVQGHRAGFFSRHWLLSVQFNHFAPGYRLATSAVGKLMPVDFRPFLALMCLGQALSIVLFHRIVTFLWGARWIHVLAAAAIACTPLLTAPTQWFSAALQGIPTVFFGLLCVYGYVRWRAGGGWRWHALSAAALALGLCFYIRVALVPFYIVGIEALFLSGGRGPRAALRSLWDRRSMWQSYLIVLGTYAGFFIATEAFLVPDIGSHGDVHGVGAFAKIVALGWGKAAVPLMLGVRTTQGATTTGQWVAVALGQLLVLALVAESVRRRRSAIGAWAFLAVAFAAGLIAVAHGRLTVVGYAIAYDTRYLVDAVWLLPFAVCAAFAPTRAAVPSAGRLRERLALPRPAALAAGVAAVAIVGTLGFRTSQDILRSWPGPESRAWVSTLRAELARAPAAGVVADQIPPGFTVPTFSNFKLSDILRFVAPSRRVEGPVPGQLLWVGPKGRLKRVEVAARFGGDAAAALRAGRLTVVGSTARARLRGREVCLAPGAAPATLQLTGPLVHSQTLYLDLTGHTSPARPQPLAFRTAGTGGYAQTTDLPLLFEPGAARTVRWLNSSDVAGVQIDVPAQTTLCLSRIVAGPLHRAPGP